MPNSMVRYAARSMARSGSRYAPYAMGPRMAMAARGASFAYKNRHRIARGAKMVSRAYANRKRKRRGTSRIANAKVRGPRHQTEVWGDREREFAMSRAKLYIRPLKFGIRAPNELLTGHRLLGEIIGSRVNVKGMNLCMNLRNAGTAVDQTIRLHIALVQKKSMDRDGDETNDYFIKEKFFSDPTNPSDRYLNFNDDYAGGIQRFDLRKDCLGINKNKFNIVFHKKVTLSGSDTNVGTYSEKRLDNYYRINKSFTYEKPDDPIVSQPLFFLMWWDFMHNATESDNTNLRVMCTNTTSFTNNGFFK